MSSLALHNSNKNTQIAISLFQGYPGGKQAFNVHSAALCLFSKNMLDEAQK